MMATLVSPKTTLAVLTMTMRSHEQPVARNERVPPRAHAHDEETGRHERRARRPARLRVRSLARPSKGYATHPMRRFAVRAKVMATALLTLDETRRVSSTPDRHRQIGVTGATSPIERPMKLRSLRRSTPAAAGASFTGTNDTARHGGIVSFIDVTGSIDGAEAASSCEPTRAGLGARGDGLRARPRAGARTGVNSGIDEMPPQPVAAIDHQGVTGHE